MNAPRPDRRRRGPSPTVVLAVGLPTVLAAALLLRVPAGQLADETTGFPKVMDAWVVAVVVVGGLLAAQRLRWYYGRRLAHGPAGATPSIPPPPPLEPAAQRAMLVLLLGASLPFAVFGAMAWASPGLHPGLWRLVSAAALLPPALLALFGLLPRALTSSLRPAAAVLCVISALVALGAVEVVLRVARGPLRTGPATVSAPDRSHWHYAPGRVVEEGGRPLTINSWGLRGDEPPPPSEGQVTVLVLGDSIPFGVRLPVERTFPAVAEARLADRAGDGAVVRVVNASLPYASITQTCDLYRERLAGLPHDVVVFAFHLDAVNRPARYRKDGLLYSPSYPEWMQDLYHHSHVVHELLFAAHVRDDTFLHHRDRGPEQALPDALQALADVHAAARERGARLAVFEIPRFDWPGTLPHASDYGYPWAIRALARWCDEHDVPLGSALPALVGRDMAAMRVSRHDIHLTEEGHGVVGAVFADFLATLREEPAGP